MMTTKQENIFDMVNSKGFVLIIKETPDSNSNIFFEYYGLPWIFKKDGKIYSNGFNFDDKGESIEEIVPEFLKSLNTFLKEGYGKRKLYEMELSGEKITHSDLVEYVIYEWNRREQEEIDRKLAIYNGWDSYLSKP